MDALWRFGVGDLRRAYDDDVTTPAEVVDVFLRRIERLDPMLGAFTQVFWDGAAGEAAGLVRVPVEDRGPLYGVPVAVKEIIDVAGASITFGSDVFRDRIAAEDAEVVRRLRAAGAIVIGITRSHEFAWGITTRHPRNPGTVNPWNRERTPGGSSGGSAAAVAAGLVPLALGSDTGGSIRIPAAFNGIAGLKPTWGRVSKRGVLPLAPSLDVLGLLARSVDDLQIAFDAVSGWDESDPESEPWPAIVESGHVSDARGLRVIVLPALHVRPLGATYARVFGRFVDDVRASGAAVDTVDESLPSEVASVFGPVQLAEAHHVHSTLLKTYPSRASDYGEDVARRLEMAGRLSLAEYLTARRGMAEIRATMLRLLRGRDALLVPVGAAGPSRVSDPDTGEINGREFPLREVVMNYTTPANVAGLPACTIPIGFDDDGVPIGVQLIGPPGIDERLMHIAGLLRSATGFDPGFPDIDPVQDAAGS